MKADERQARLDKMREDRIAKFAKGLSEVGDLEIEEIHENTSSDAMLTKYTSDAHDELKAIMAEAERTRPKGPPKLPEDE